MSLFIPLEPNWNTPVREVYTFRTDIFVSRSQKEQRRSKRMNPRTRIEYASLVAREEMRGVLNAFYTRSDDSQRIIDPISTPMTLLRSAEKNTTSLLVEATASWFDGTGVVVADGNIPLTVTSTVDNDSFSSGFAGGFSTPVQLNLSEPLPKALDVGTRLSSTFVGRMPNQPTVSYVTDNVGVVQVAFDLLPGSPITPTTSPAAVIDGREVFTFKPNWVNQASHGFNSPVETVDMGYGVTEVFAPVDFVSRSMQYVFQQTSAAEIASIRDFFLRMKGRRGEFWCPTFTDDLTLTVGAYAQQTGIRVRGRAADFADRTLAGIAITKTSGQVLYLRVLSIVDEDTPVAAGGMGGFNDGFAAGIGEVDYGELGDQVYITLADPLAASLSLDDVQMVSWMPLSRFASDELVLSYTTDSVADALLNIVSLEYRLDD